MEEAHVLETHKTIALPQLRPLPEPAPESFGEPQAVPAQPDRQTTVLDAIEGNVERLRVTLMWVGGPFAFFVLALAFK